MLNIERYKDKIAEKMKNSDCLAKVFYEYCEDYGPTDILDWLLSDAPILTEKRKKIFKGSYCAF